MIRCPETGRNAKDRTSHVRRFDWPDCPNERLPVRLARARQAGARSREYGIGINHAGSRTFHDRVFATSGCVLRDAIDRHGQPNSRNTDVASRKHRGCASCLSSRRCPGQRPARAVAGDATIAQHLEFGTFARRCIARRPRLARRLQSRRRDLRRGIVGRRRSGRRQQHFRFRRRRDYNRLRGPRSWSRRWGQCRGTSTRGSVRTLSCGLVVSARGSCTLVCSAGATTGATRRGRRVRSAMPETKSTKANAVSRK